MADLQAQQDEVLEPFLDAARKVRAEGGSSGLYRTFSFSGAQLTRLLDAYEGNVREDDRPRARGAAEPISDAPRSDAQPPTTDPGVILQPGTNPKDGTVEDPPQEQQETVPEGGAPPAGAEHESEEVQSERAKIADPAAPPTPEQGNQGTPGPNDGSASPAERGNVPNNAPGN